MISTRDYLRRLAPPGLRATVRTMKKRMMGPAEFEVELGRYVFAADPESRPRLTLVIPTTLRRNVFGGIATGLDLFLQVAQALKQHGPLDMRVLQTAPEDPEPDNVVMQAAAGLGLDIAAIAFEPRFYKGSTLRTRSAEIFMPFNWYCADNLRDVLVRQSAHFGGAPRPLVFPVQEYEPGLYPMSSDQLLARETYDADWPIHALVNSSQLAAWLRRMGHDFDHMHVFEPRLSAALRPFLDQVAATPRKKRILVYGRPTENRNCFAILQRGLQIWAHRFPEFADWEVVSAGMAHPPVPLGGGRVLRSIGKLSLEHYAQTLCESAIGISLMASPHPSYPPLEMAHFGMRTVTNRFAEKDLSTAHDNIVSLSSARPEVLAETLADACRAFLADPQAGPRGRSHLPDYLGEGPAYPFLDTLVQDLLPALQGRPVSEPMA